MFLTETASSSFLEEHENIKFFCITIMPDLLSSNNIQNTLSVSHTKVSEMLLFLLWSKNYLCEIDLLYIFHEG